MPEQREIKFRFWNKAGENSSMFYNSEQVMECLKQQVLFNKGNLHVGYDHVSEGCAFMQYTGLKDKKGKEIYEGDICKILDPYEENKKVFEVEYKNGGFIVEWDSMFCGGEADTTTIGWAIDEEYIIEIIGNIYENPELIKQL